MACSMVQSKGESMTPEEIRLRQRISAMHRAVDKAVALALFDIHKHAMMIRAHMDERISWHNRSIGQIRRYEIAKQFYKGK